MKRPTSILDRWADRSQGGFCLEVIFQGLSPALTAHLSLSTDKCIAVDPCPAFTVPQVVCRATYDPAEARRYQIERTAYVKHPGDGLHTGPTHGGFCSPNFAFFACCGWHLFVWACRSDVEEAISCANEALAISPNHALAQSLLVSTTSSRVSAAETQSLKAVLPK